MELGSVSFPLKVSVTLHARHDDSVKLPSWTSRSYVPDQKATKTIQQI
jgi:hypothetical protein